MILGVLHLSFLLPYLLCFKHWYVPMYTWILLLSPNPVPSISMSVPPWVTKVVEIAVIFNSISVIHMAVANPLEVTILVLYSPYGKSGTVYVNNPVESMVASTE